MIDFILISTEDNNELCLYNFSLPISIWFFLKLQTLTKIKTWDIEKILLS